MTRGRAMALSSQHIPVAKPRLPDAHAVLPYIRQIDRNAWYSNHGPLSRQFQARLARHFGVATEEVVLLANGTSALTLALLASGAKPGSRCLMPSWTFIASAGAVTAAGLRPSFVDVCPETWAPDPNEVKALAAQDDVGAILVVAPFGAPIDLHAWDDVSRTTGVPVVIDAAAAFDTLRAGGPMPIGRCPVIVSLHATKIFGVGEGGVLLSRDPILVERVRRHAQFGFLGTREAMLPGVNAKLSEYAAAVGLAGLDCWPATRALWQGVTRRYCSILPDVLALPPRFGSDWLASTLTLLWPEGQPDPGPNLDGLGVGTLRWWGAGCHVQPAFALCPAEKLPATRMLARRAIGLPFWQDLSGLQIASVCRAVAAVLARSSARQRPAPVLVRA